MLIFHHNKASDEKINCERSPITYIFCYHPGMKTYKIMAECLQLNSALSF